jgi:hypothetical protein
MRVHALLAMLQVEAVRQRPDVRVVTIAKANRDAEATNILAAVRQQLGLGSGRSSAADHARS